MSPSQASNWVPETKFGMWFLGTETWRDHVLVRALDDLERIIPDRSPSYPTILDVGCGSGQSFSLLYQRFAPQMIHGVDVCPEMLDAAREKLSARELPVTLHLADCTALPLKDESVDLLLCHQTFHHLMRQEKALDEFRRVIKPKGLLLFAESTRHYICSWIIRLLFRHPMDVQQEASAYIEMIRRAGFCVEERTVSYPYLWWSRPDIGLKESLFGTTPADGHPETLVNLVGIRI